jgi:hypothetical protein
MSHLVYVSAVKLDKVGSSPFLPGIHDSLWPLVGACDVTVPAWVLAIRKLPLDHRIHRILDVIRCIW